MRSSRLMGSTLALLLGAMLAACGGSGDSAATLPAVSGDSSVSSASPTASNTSPAAGTGSAASTGTTTNPTPGTTAIKSTFGAAIDPANLPDYVGQPVPAYITKRNGSVTSNIRTTLGRVLFYDKNLSVDNTVSCASCHRQDLAFSDSALASSGVQGGVTGRHSMRLVNARFSDEQRFFWDKRAASLEDQTTRPIRDHSEMGFSGQSGRPDFNALLLKLAAIGYYQELFTLAYGDASVTESRLQEAMAMFVRSIQSFDSKFDAGRAQAANDAQPFANFTAQENNGKNLFLTPPVFDGSGNRIAGGLGCGGCHRPPEFDIDPNSGNNGIIGKLNAAGQDLTNTRAPSLRDLVKLDGSVNSPMMHTGVIAALTNAIGHYGNINGNPANTALDPRLRPNGFGQQLNLIATEVQATVAFLRTLSGVNVYTDSKWSDPFPR